MAGMQGVRPKWTSVEGPVKEEDCLRLESLANSFVATLRGGGNFAVCLSLNF